MTWNIHGAFGRNLKFDAAKVVEIVRRADADVVALQEVDSRGGQDCFAILLDALGGHGVDARSIVTGDGDYGQMLISRWPLKDTSITDISFGEFEPRRAIRARMIAPAGTVLVVATHLGLSIRERRNQARALLKLTQGDEPVVLMGDFNDWFWPGSVRSVLRAALPGRSHHRTFPSWFPLLRLDRVYCRPRDILRKVWTDKEAALVSDHLPVIADIEPIRTIQSALLQREAVTAVATTP